MICFKCGLNQTTGTASQLCAGCLNKQTSQPQIRLDLTRSDFEIKYWQAMGALGYPVPSDIPESNLKCGLCEAKSVNIIKLDAENNVLMKVIKEWMK